MHARPSFLQILPTRVRRNYAGGALLDRGEGQLHPRDVDQPEDWIASTIEAKNPGLPLRHAEGITRVKRPDGTESDLRTEIARDPQHFLGSAHVQTRGTEIGFLAKLLDSSIRLHIQAHPTAAFSRQRLDSPYGKLETYVILGARAGCDPYVLLGFKRAPAREEWRRIIAEQDLPAMHACLNRIALQPGEVWLVPGGLPHAIGEGVLMLEVMEPSDWVVRCEFEREGIVVPPAGRFMGRDLEFCLDIFDYRSESEDEIRRRCRIEPRVVTEWAAGVEEELIGPAHTGCFLVRRLRTSAAMPVPRAGTFRLMLITAGTGTLRCAELVYPLHAGSRVLLPAGSAGCELHPARESALEAIFCEPGHA